MKDDSNKEKKLVLKSVGLLERLAGFGRRRVGIRFRSYNKEQVEHSTSRALFHRWFSLGHLKFKMFGDIPYKIPSMQLGKQV